MRRFGVWLFVAGCSGVVPTDTAEVVDPCDATARYTADWDGVVALFDAECAECHTSGPVRLPAAVDDDLARGLGALVVPGDPDASALWRVLTGDLRAGDAGVMPVGEGPLPPEDLAHVCRWIRDGAPIVRPPADADEDGVIADVDCDDADPAVGAATDWYVDGDGDTFGAGAATAACVAPEGTVADATDCDDGDATVRPGAPEVCNGVDDDCADGVDESGAIGERTFHQDGDGDTFGDSDATRAACAAPSGFVDDATDCDDTDATVFPGAPESCSDVEDTNCDGFAGTFDNDLDGAVACDDCDDAEPAVHPGATEVCNDVDDDCDGSTDEAGATGIRTWYRDADGDLQGTVLDARDACAQPDGYVLVGTDCDDADVAVFDGATETCDGEDDDCSGAIDDGAVDATPWHRDEDGDGRGLATDVVASCAAILGRVTSSDDCLDTDPTVFLGAPEVCDGVDDDCDGAPDDGASDGNTYFVDVDGDTWGAGGPFFACAAPSDAATRAGDCDDTRAGVNPGGTADPTDTVDNDCDGLVDEDDRVFSFAADVQPILTSRCSSCHSEPGPSGGLDLTPDAFPRIVNVRALPTALDQVEPGASAQSYLWLKLTGEHVTVAAASGGLMPPSGPLPAVDLATIRTWIDRGAAP